MKSGHYFTVLFLGVLCLLLCVSVVALAFVNERQQNRLDQRTQELNRGMMGAEAQQISGRVLQDLGAVAQQNAALRMVLAKHGYEIARPPAAALPPGTNALPVNLEEETEEAMP